MEGQCYGALSLAPAFMGHLLWTQVMVAHRGHSLTGLVSSGLPENPPGTARTDQPVIPQAKIVPLRARVIAKSTENLFGFFRKLDF